MQIKPHITLLFLLSVFTVLLLTSLFIPNNGVKIVGETRLKFFNERELFSTQEKYADISDIIKQNPVFGKIRNFSYCRIKQFVVNHHVALRFHVLP